MIPHALPPPLGTTKRFAEYNFKRNIVEILAKEDEEDRAWDSAPKNLEARQKLLDELDKEKQDNPELDVEDLEKMYGQVVYKTAFFLRCIFIKSTTQLKLVICWFKVNKTSMI